MYRLLLAMTDEHGVAPYRSVVARAARLEGADDEAGRARIRRVLHSMWRSGVIELQKDSASGRWRRVLVDFEQFADRQFTEQARQLLRAFGAGTAKGPSYQAIGDECGVTARTAKRWIEGDTAIPRHHEKGLREILLRCEVPKELRKGMLETPELEQTAAAMLSVILRQLPPARIETLIPVVLMLIGMCAWIEFMHGSLEMGQTIEETLVATKRGFRPVLEDLSATDEELIEFAKGLKEPHKKWERGNQLIRRMHQRSLSAAARGLR